MKRLRSAAIGLTGLLGLGAAYVSEPPDAAINSETGQIETATSVLAEAHYEVLHTTYPGSGLPKITVAVSTGSTDGLAPRIAINGSGDTWITWWEDGDTPQVRARKHSQDTQSWGDVRLVSELTESARLPEIVADGDLARIVYRTESATGQSIVVGVIGDEPDPIPQFSVRTTSYEGDVAARIHSEAGHIWVTWRDDEFNLGVSQLSLVTEQWSSPSFVVIGEGDIDSARAEARSSFLE